MRIEGPSPPRSLASSPLPPPAAEQPALPVDRAEIGQRQAGRLETAEIAKRPAAPRRDWRDEVLYFVMVDRFANGDKTNDQGVDLKDPQKFHGGDWQGVIDHLDDLKNLGVTTVWLSPPVLNDHDFLGMHGYHGYWVQDFYQTDPHFGTLEKLRELVDKAHEKGMRVVLDLIVNHVGYNHPFAKDPARHDWFHHEGNVSVLTNRGLENGALHGLPDLAQENPEVSKYLMDMAKWWVQQTGIDGFRVDAVRHVPRAWLREFADEMHKTFGDDFILVGEAYTPFTKEVASYQKDAHFDSLFDFPAANAIRSAIGFDEKRGLLGAVSDAWKLIGKNPHEAFRLMTHRHADMRSLSSVFAEDKNYPDSSHLATMIDNHDMQRFPVLAGPDARGKTKLALSLLFTMRGIPTMYYGTEDGMGAWDEDNRADKKWGADPQMFDYIRQLTHIRADSPALRRGEQVELRADSDVYAFARVHDKDRMVVALNRSEKERTRKIAVEGKVDLADGTVLEDVRTHSLYKVDDGKLRVDIPPREALILKVRDRALPDDTQ
jgi:alpha-amylase